MRSIYPQTGARAIAEAMRTHLVDCDVGLIKAPFPLDKQLTLADLTEANYSGYARKTIAAHEQVYDDPAGGATFQSPLQQFNFVAPVAPAEPVPNTIYGFFVLDDAGELIMVGDFEAGLPMATNNNSIPLNISPNFGK